MQIAQLPFVVSSQGIKRLEYTPVVSLLSIEPDRLSRKVEYSTRVKNPLQTERLLGLALNISSDISVWIDEEEKRREKQHN